MLKEVVEEIIRNRVIPESYTHWRPLAGGTNSMVGVIGTASEPNQYIVKLNTPERIAAEAQFLKMYNKLALLPKVKYIDSEFRYFLYSFTPGEVRYNRRSKAYLMNELVERMIKHYIKPENPDDYEWVEDPLHTVQDIEYTRSVIGLYILDQHHELVKKLNHRRGSRVSKEGLRVLHGDFGVHNFLFQGDELSGIIDPIPGIGRPLYDLLYAFCSSPDQLTLPILLNAVEKLEGEHPIVKDLIEDMILALYSRIGTCLTHHPEDLAEYLKAWEEWIGIFHEGEKAADRL